MDHDLKHVAISVGELRCPNLWCLVLDCLNAGSADVRHDGTLPGRPGEPVATPTALAGCIDSGPASCLINLILLVGGLLPGSGTLPVIAPPVKG